MATGRPYRDFVEAEAREYWQEIAKPGSLVKPTTLEMYDTLPIRRDARHRAEAENRYAEALAAAMQPWPEADATRAMEPERPYQAFVESEARKYWQETSQAGALAKPTQAQIRAAALPILCLALRNRPGNRRYVAVADVVQHAKEQGWMSRFNADANESPSYIEALIQLADDTNRLAREIPLPDHPPPHHPPIYYEIGTYHGRPVPVPRKNAIIRGNYLRSREGYRITDEEFIYPVRVLPYRDLRMTWTVPLDQSTAKNTVNRYHLDFFSPIYYGLTFERAKLPVNRRKVCVWVDWREQLVRTVHYYSSHLRDYPYPSLLVFSPNPRKP